MQVQQDNQKLAAELQITNNLNQKMHTVLERVVFQRREGGNFQTDTANLKCCRKYK